MHCSLLVAGKCVRPILSLTAYELVGGRERQAMPSVVAVEIVQTMSLIHNDIPCMDDDDLHHGKPSNHHVFDEPITIVAGNALLTLAFDHLAKPASYLADNPIPPTYIVHTVVELSHSIRPEGLVAGQMVDKESMVLAIPFGLNQLEIIHLHKTVFLLEASVVIGAIVGGGSNDQIELLR
ncbi:putative Heterodimeric geranylgeranyl pyrophosphate synthase large subunit 1, chloroplastic [Cocos nucifera]|nr:putative Heterodimeric geranylgeranyl pyrophosphate synthase large subunit 1, chloroplastic [Cocos nucifera]